MLDKVGFRLIGSD